MVIYRFYDTFFDMETKKYGAVAHPLKKKDRSKSQKKLYNFGLLL